MKNSSHMDFIPPAVSRWYRYDWQYAVDISHIPILSEAALLISVTPIVVSFSTVIFPSLHGVKSFPVPLLLLWGASVAFVCAWALLYVRCPKFIREYRDFGQYSLRRHSHRWIVWEFYNNLRSLSGWENVVRETTPKGLTIEIGHLDESLARTIETSFTAVGSKQLEVFKPVNINRDIYLPIYTDGKKIILAMEENDPALHQKEKELFWILYSQAAKERPRARTLYWILIGIAAALVAINVIRKIYEAVNYLMS